MTEHGADHGSCALEFAAWCERNVHPWYADHVDWDAQLLRRWSGEDVDRTRPLPSDLVVAAAERMPSLFRVVGPYLMMEGLPARLAEVEPQARELFASGWRPPVPPGPSRDDIAALAAAVIA